MLTKSLVDQIHWENAGKESNLLAKAGIEHGFFGRGDSAPEAHHVRQVHGTRVVQANPDTTGAKSSHRTEADALFTFEPGTVISVKTADCLPILVAIPGKVALGVHAGWRGLTSGIIDKAVSKLADFGLEASGMVAAVGPTISREKFEVGSEVVDALLSPSSGLSAEQAAFVLSKGRGDRWHIDLQVAAALALINSGIPAQQVSVVQACTHQTPGWNSYRREGKDCGVNWSWIRLKSI